MPTIFYVLHFSFLPWQLAYTIILISSVNEANSKSRGLVGINSMKVFKFSLDLNGVPQEEALRFPHISPISSFLFLKTSHAHDGSAPPSQLGSTTKWKDLKDEG